MPTLFTIGHSTHPIQAFLDILHTYDISHLVDVRSIPKSRHVPWFNQAALKHALKKEKIHYTHLAALGGLRHTSKDSMNTAWKNASFRGFADYMQTPAFFAGLKELNQLLQGDNHVVIMCAEALPWRCHRSLIADAEIIRHIEVWDIMSKTQLHPHHLTEFAVVDRDKRPMQIYYPK